MERWRRKPGDRVVRLHLQPYKLRRVLGVPALYSAGYGNVGSSIYYALGIVALVAMGATPVVLLIAGLFFLFTALTYAEGSALLPEAGGSASFARYGFNELIGFISGWALMLSYIVTIAISAFIIPPYLGYFWEPLKTNPVIGTYAAMGIILFLMLLNILGIRESSLVNIIAATLDLITQLFIVVLGIAFLFSVPLLLERIQLYWPAPTEVIFGIALAALAFTGVETISQMSEETRRPAFRVPRALMLMAVTVLVIFSGISITAFLTMTPEELANNWSKDPIAGIAYYLPQELAKISFPSQELTIVFSWVVEGLGRVLPLLVALLAVSILFLATNAGLIGISRLAFSLGRNRQLPPVLSRIHYQFKTPYVSLLFFTAVALLLLVPAFFSPQILLNLGALYTFGSLLSFFLAHAAILSLRWRYPHIRRPWKIGFNIPLGKGRSLPLTAVLGALFTFSVWLVIVYLQPFTRWVGLGWLGLGLIIYLLYRFYHRLELTSSPRLETSWRDFWH